LTNAPLEARLKQYQGGRRKISGEKIKKLKTKASPEAVVVVVTCH